MPSARDYMVRLERELMSGNGRWVADFVESYWEYPAGGVTFDVFLHGGMRPKGYVLSRFVARFAMPDYLAACFAIVGQPDGAGLNRVVKAVGRHMKEHELKWSWLVLPSEQPFTSQAKSRVEKNNMEEVGIALVDLSTEEIITSQSYPGRRMGRFIRCFK